MTVPTEVRGLLDPVGVIQVHSLLPDYSDLSLPGQLDSIPE